MRGGEIEVRGGEIERLGLETKRRLEEKGHELEICEVEPWL